MLRILLLIAFSLALPCPVIAQPALQKHLLFSSFDLWRGGHFASGGWLYAPSGIETSGPLVMLDAGSGTYQYHAHRLRVHGAVTSASALAGWRLYQEKFIFSLLAGLEGQTHDLAPDDVSNAMRGTHVGARMIADLWAEPRSHLMVNARFAVSSIGSGWDGRLALGVRAADGPWLGPEVSAAGNETSALYRIGLHLTGLKLGPVETRVSAGWMQDSDRASGAYGTLSAWLKW